MLATECLFFVFSSFCLLKFAERIFFSLLDDLLFMYSVLECSTVQMYENCACVYVHQFRVNV